jgi:hypothetical protein
VFTDPEGTDAAGSEAIARLLRSEREYRRLFGHPSPDIDFRREEVVFYSVGTEDTIGYRTGIVALEKRRLQLEVTTYVEIPGVECDALPVRSSTSVLARVSNAGYVRTARFEHIQRGDEDCPPAPSCGGIAGTGCDGLATCVDDPRDDCDLEQGGADCGGFCSCTALAKCKDGEVFDRDPRSCACIEDPCTSVDCGPGAVCETIEADAYCVSDGGMECGPNTCAEGRLCCSARCGICAAPLDCRKLPCSL